ncbi:MAG: adenosylcobalamin-dependent ribonucleoside-diphosphate reductase, partial [Nitrospiraceae bacterium]|nr:adenosylcobalamin-dependent ribonucleoside-diphosphate reductase [Nitrospiraceae bacterium]
NHPDIMEFINCKRDKKSFSNFNISVAATDEFFEKLKSNGELELVNPRDKSIWGRLKAQDVFDAIAQAAWETGDPGMLYIDEINRKNPTPLLGKIEATNPCGEVPLLPNEMCTLGSINLSKVINKGSINWGKLKELVHMGVRFLDNVVDLNNYPTKNIERMAKSNRKIGLGVMGFAEALIKLSIPYNSEDAIETAERIMSFINEEAFRASSLLAEERGSFPNIEMSIYKGKKLRNATRTTIAPTGSISMIAQTSPSIEPLFAIAYVKKNILGGKRFIKVNPIFERYARKLTDAEFEEAVKTGSVQGIKDIPENIKRVFVTALDMAPEWHVRMQAAFQKYTDNAVSKTVNLRHDASVEDVKRIYLLGHKLKLKGITIFRYGSKEGVIEFGVKKFDFEKLFKCKTEGCRPI